LNDVARPHEAVLAQHTTSLQTCARVASDHQGRENAAIASHRKTAGRTGAWLTAYYNATGASMSNGNPCCVSDFAQVDRKWSPDGQNGAQPSRFTLVARWVDIVQVAPPPVIEREPEPIASPRAVVLVFIAIVLALTLATIEVLFRCPTRFSW